MKHDKRPKIIPLTEEKIIELTSHIDEEKLTAEDKLFLQEILINTQELIKYIKTH